jgi:hypothetical protein
VVEDEAEGRALRQIKEKGYADKYRSPIHLIGVGFPKGKRNEVGFEVDSEDGGRSGRGAAFGISGQ